MSFRQTSLSRVSGVLHCEGVALNDIAAKVGTPTYVYSQREIAERYQQVDEALSFVPHLVAYAVKANSNLAVLACLAKLGAGADIVSGGELARCLKAGFEPSKIVFSGIGKREEEIESAVQANIRSIHIESEPELDLVSEVAIRLGKPVRISLRVNPDVDAKTHPYIATGLHNTKFGLEVDRVKALAEKIKTMQQVKLTGLSTHIGSQIADPNALRDATKITAALGVELKNDGAPIESIDAGGGWPIDYGDEKNPFPALAKYGTAVRDGLKAAGKEASSFRITVETGRAIVGPAGCLLTRVVREKDQPERRFVVVDAAMNDLLRPSLYRAHHEIITAKDEDSPPLDRPTDVVGPVCETGDFLAKDVALPELKTGSLLAVLDAGAYAMVMASNYNSRPRPAEVLVDDTSYRVVRKRESTEDLWQGEET